MALSQKIAAASINRTSITAPYTVAAIRRLFEFSNGVPADQHQITPSPSWATGTNRRTDGSLLSKTVINVSPLIQKRFSSSGSGVVDTSRSTIVPDFSKYKKYRSGDYSNRTFTYLMVGATGALTAAGAKATVTDFLVNMSAASDVLAMAKVEVDLSKIPEGKNVTIKWRGKPIFIRHRTPDEIAEASSVDLAHLKDPQTDADRTKKPEWLVMLVRTQSDFQRDYYVASIYSLYISFTLQGVCTHLGCVPIGESGDFGGWYCPCHGSHYDISGRVRKGPAPLNLEVPPHDFPEDELLHRCFARVIKFMDGLLCSLTLRPRIEAARKLNIFTPDDIIASLKTFTDIIHLSQNGLTKKLRISSQDALELVQCIYEKVYETRIKPTTALNLIFHHEQRFLTTTDEILDQVLGGGILSRGITEIVAKKQKCSAVGKTQLCLQLCLAVQLPKELGGLGGGAVYLHSDGVFPARRFYQLIDRFSREYELQSGHDLGENVYCATLLDLKTQENFWELEYQQRKFAVTTSDITNSNVNFIVHKNYDGTKIPTLGLVWSNTINVRIILTRPERRTRSNSRAILRRKISILFSPYAPQNSGEYYIDENGIHGVRSNDQMNLI
ncbi:4165_t:CDS:2 [Ambispora leptoticha]|uniref:4165_t:CDS:1 n=1 Tax=Ambispora leptoticha TaxID=144679 RepID=A0A9N9BSB4_9GLOM|nr:4165_t:CDS:2 [Ambispora leptoticha]